MKYYVYVYEPYENETLFVEEGTEEEVKEFLLRRKELYLDNITILEGVQHDSWDFAKRLGLRVELGKVVK